MSKKTDVELSEVTVTGPDKKTKKRRASADQTNGRIKSIIRNTQSHSSLRQPPRISTIREDEEQSKSEGLQTLSVPNLQRKTSTASGATVKSAMRASNRSSKSSRSHASCVNPGFVASNTEGDALSFQSRYSSSQSLSTYKEQYCCSPNCRFTPRERKLCTAVAVLATIIVILVIVVGYLADQKGGENTFRWKF